MKTLALIFKLDFSLKVKVLWAFCSFLYFLSPITLQASTGHQHDEGPNSLIKGVRPTIQTVGPCEDKLSSLIPASRFELAKLLDLGEGPLEGWEPRLNKWTVGLSGNDDNNQFVVGYRNSFPVGYGNRVAFIYDFTNNSELRFEANYSDYKRDLSPILSNGFAIFFSERLIHLKNLKSGEEREIDIGGDLDCLDNWGLQSSHSGLTLFISSFFMPGENSALFRTDDLSVKNFSTGGNICRLSQDGRQIISDGEISSNDLDIQVVQVEPLRGGKFPSLRTISSDGQFLFDWIARENVIHRRGLSDGSVDSFSVFEDFRGEFKISKINAVSDTRTLLVESIVYDQDRSGILRTKMVIEAFDQSTLKRLTTRPIVLPSKASYDITSDGLSIYFVYKKIDDHSKHSIVLGSSNLNGENFTSREMLSVLSFDDLPVLQVDRRGRVYVQIFNGTDGLYQVNASAL